ncbi:hypothetical protein ACFVVA_36875 [Kitasatospora sp. NPDC058048]|uniref:hypothetical protein n=1 Tax=Kitasatospora sp. NPDC058048 TaxID=3346313 RepID=UPI0036DDC35E
MSETAPASLPDVVQIRASDPVPRTPVARALQTDVTHAVGALRAMRDPDGPDDGADVAVVVYTAVVCTGATPATALQAAADWTLQAPHAEVHSLSLARVPGHREDVAEFCVTLTVSFPDEQTGEYTGDTHHAAGPMAHVVVSGIGEEPQ